MRPNYVLSAVALLLAAGLTANCEQGDVLDAGPALAPLPVAVTNNAVAAVHRDGATYLYSFNGLGPGKGHGDTLAAAFELEVAKAVWRELPDVPGNRGVLASVAAAAGGRVFLFGGYTVAEDGSEVSTPEVYALEPGAAGYPPVYLERAPMPTPVDDSVALTYLDRYIYLVSGWHDKGNVDLVQVYDTVEDRWFKATEYPGPPVFGHAGGIVGNILVIADGVKVAGERDGRRQFVISDAAWVGVIDPDDAAAIHWREIPAHPGESRYRMAAVGLAAKAAVVFAGGSPNPYNFNGIGYDGVPSAATDQVFSFSTQTGSWQNLGAKPRATMDHRGLIPVGDSLCTIGGMTTGQKVIAEVNCFLWPK